MYTTLSGPLWHSYNNIDSVHGNETSVLEKNTQRWWRINFHGEDSNRFLLNIFMEEERRRTQLSLPSKPVMECCIPEDHLQYTHRYCHSCFVVLYRRFNSQEGTFTNFISLWWFVTIFIRKNWPWNQSHWFCWMILYVWLYLFWVSHSFVHWLLDAHAGCVTGCGGLQIWNNFLHQIYFQTIHESFQPWNKPTI